MPLPTSEHVTHLVEMSFRLEILLKIILTAQSSKRFKNFSAEKGFESVRKTFCVKTKTREKFNMNSSYEIDANLVAKALQVIKENDCEFKDDTYVQKFATELIR